MRYFRLTIVWSFILFALLYGPTISAAAIQQAAAAAGDASNTIPPTDANEWGNKFLWAMVSSWFMKLWRSNPKLGGFTENTALWAQRLIGAAVAFVNGMGIHFAFDKTTGQLVITGLIITSLLHGVQQFLLQEFVYHAALKKSPTT